MCGNISARLQDLWPLSRPFTVLQMYTFGHLRPLASSAASLQLQMLRISGKVSDSLGITRAFAVNCFKLSGKIRINFPTHKPRPQTITLLSARKQSKNSLEFVHVLCSIPSVL